MRIGFAMSNDKEESAVSPSRGKIPDGNNGMSGHLGQCFSGGGGAAVLINWFVALTIADTATKAAMRGRVSFLNHQDPSIPETKRYHGDYHEEDVPATDAMTRCGRCSRIGGTPAYKGA